VAQLAASAAIQRGNIRWFNVQFQIKNWPTVQEAQSFIDLRNSREMNPDT
jgi:hypothetical protein